MTVVYGVFDPGFRAGLEPCGMIADSAAAYLFRNKGVPAAWGTPTRCVGWFDKDEMLQGAVANYANGKAAIIRYFRGRWELTFGDAPK
ncbi:MAG: hypothetical protein ACO1NM_09670 [Sphingobium phenoxybenzoativorans]